MYQIYFYKDKNGKEPVREYINELAAHNDKNSRIKLTKIRDYLKVLSEHGTRAGEPYIKHLDGDIWELGPSGIGYCLRHGMEKRSYCSTIL